MQTPPTQKMATLEGETNVLNQWIEIVRQKYCAKGKLDHIYRNLKSLTRDKERFSFVWSLEEVQSAIKRLKINIPTKEKSTDFSETLRSEGNALFQRSLYKEALLKYNDSILTAPLSAKDNEQCAYAMALASRSAALFHLKHYRESLVDIDAAIEYGYPQNLWYKLLDRKGRCLYKIRSFFEAASSFEKSLESLSKSTLEGGKHKEWTVKLEKVMQQCMALCNNNKSVDQAGKPEQNLNGKGDDLNRKEPSTITQSLSKKCTTGWDGAKGTCIVAVDNILPGETILKEEPYAAVLLPDYYDDHCHHCLSPLLTVTPCDSCSYVRFCGNDCKKSATYHKHECMVLKALVSSGVDRFSLLALRIITKTPYHDLFGEMAGRADFAVKSSAQVKRSGFDDITSLVTHGNLRDGKDIWRRTLTAVFIAQLLAQSWFISKVAIVTGLPEEVIVMRIGTWLLVFLQMLPCNAHSVSELSLKPKAVFESCSNDIAAAIYPTLSRLNHSCDPGVTRVFHGSAVTSVAIRLIRKGEEVCDNYGAVYAIQNRSVRYEILRPQYYFTCRCEACENDWPLCTEQSAFSPLNWRCEQCGASLPNLTKCEDGQQYHIETKGRTQSTVHGGLTDELKTNGQRNANGSDVTASSKTQSDPSVLSKKYTSVKNSEVSPFSIIRCSKCLRQQTIQSKITALKTSGPDYLQALDLLKAGKAEKALPALLTHLKTIETTVSHPWRDLVMCQEAVKQCYSLLANCQVTT